MQQKQIFKITIDTAMTILIIILMAYHITGSRLHEWLGTALFLLFILHHALNIGWYKGLFKGKYTPARIFMSAVNFLLFLAMLGTMASGIMLSREVFVFLHLKSGMTGRRLHMISTVWCYLLMAMHLGLHWGMVIGMAKKLSLHGKWTALASRILVFLISAYGIYAFWARRLAERMFLLVEFVFSDYNEPAVFFFADYITILVLFAALSYYCAYTLKKCPAKVKE